MDKKKVTVIQAAKSLGFGGATHFALQNGRIVQAGSESAVRSWLLRNKPPLTEELNFEKGVVLPGLADLHCHPVTQGITAALKPLYVFGFLNKKDIVSELKRAISGKEDEIRERGILLVYGLNTTNVKDLTREDLDGVLADVPIIVFDPSYHSAVVNTKALLAIKKKASERENETGLKLKGECTNGGKLTEDYVFLSFAVMDDRMGKDLNEIAKKEAEIVRGWLLSAIKKGITYCHELIIFTPAQALALLRAAEEWENEYGSSFPLKRTYLRPEVFYAILRNPDRYSEVREALERWLNINAVGIKFLADGSISSYTAFVADSYLDTHTNGMVFDSFEKAKKALELVRELDIRNVRMHAIGDNGIRHALAVAGEAKRIIGEGADIGIEHFEISHYKDILERAAKLGITVLSQPNFLTDFFDYQERLGNRVNLFCPHRSILEEGIPLVFGTDGMPQSMLFAVWAAVHHPIMDQRLGLDEAIAIASLRTEKTQRVDPDVADLVVIDEKTYSELSAKRTEEEIKEKLRKAWTFCEELDKGVISVMVGGKRFK